jgi:hypothetical protein
MPSVLDFNVPLVGQQLKLVSTTILSMYACQCAPGDALTFVLQMAGDKLQTLPVVCPRCQTTYTINAIHADKGQVSFGFAMASPPSDAA